MVPQAYRSLAAAVAWSLPTAVVARISLPAAAAIAVAGLLIALASTHPLRKCGLCALPMLLAALPTAEPLPTMTTPGPVRVEGRVRDVVRAPLDDRSYVYLGRKLRLAFPGNVELLPGDRIRVLARRGATAIPGVAAPLVATPATLAVRPGPWSFRRGCAYLRRALERQLLRMVPGEHGVMLATLVLGRATRPDRDLAAAHRATGLSHLLAVSGAHAAMLAFLLGLSSRSRHLGASRTRSMAVLLILLVYGCIAGAEPPVLRAVVAFTLATIAARIGRPFGIATGLLVPAWITGLIEPEALLGPSFLLSYAAVIGLALALRARRPETASEWLVDGLRASFWATLLTAPLTLGFFGQLAPWTILLTPLCAPLVAIMLLLGLIAASLALFAPALADLLAWPLHGLASTYAAMVHAADALPGTPIPAWFQPPAWALVLVAGAGTAWVLTAPSKRNLMLSILAIATLWFIPLQPPSKQRFVLLAIGHGQAALLNTAQGHQAIIDCGSMQGGYRAARRMYEALTVRTIDLIIITHADSDHHSGVAFLLPRVRVQHAILPMALAQSPLHALLLDHGCEVTVLAPGTTHTPLPNLQVFAPDLPDLASDNDQSLWVRTTIHDTSLLLSGDAQELGIAAALASDFVHRSDVLVLPHHGRRNANAAHLLARVRPRACLASAATGDGQTQLGALARRFGADLWVTGQHGTITLRGSPPVIASELARKLP